MTVTRHDIEISTLETERDQLRAEVERLQGKYNSLGTLYNSCRTRLDEMADGCTAATARAEAAEATVAGLRLALEGVRLRAAFVGHPGEAFYNRGDGVMVPDWREALQQLETALAASPADHARRIKSEALKEMARLFMATAKSDLSYHNRDLAARFCNAAASELEATNGR